MYLLPRKNFYLPFWYYPSSKCSFISQILCSCKITPTKRVALFHASAKTALRYGMHCQYRYSCFVSCKCWYALICFHLIFNVSLFHWIADTYSLVSHNCQYSFGSCNCQCSFLSHNSQFRFVLCCCWCNLFHAFVDVALVRTIINVALLHAIVNAVLFHTIEHVALFHPIGVF